MSQYGKYVNESVSPAQTALSVSPDQTALICRQVCVFALHVYPEGRLSKYVLGSHGNHFRVMLLICHIALS